MPVWLIATGVAIVWVAICVLVHIDEQRKKPVERPSTPKVPAEAQEWYREEMQDWDSWCERVREAEEVVADLEQQDRDLRYAQEELDEFERRERRDTAELDEECDDSHYSQEREKLEVENRKISKLLERSRSMLADVRAQIPRKPSLEEHVRAYNSQVAADEAADAALLYRGGAPPYHAYGTVAAESDGGRRQLFDDVREGIWKGITSAARAAVIVFCLGLAGTVWSTLTDVAMGQLILASYAVANAVSFLLMAIDKLLARAGERRIREATLHLIEAFGGFAGSFLAQQFFRHKIRKRKYQAAYWTIVTLHVACSIWWFTIGMEWVQSLGESSGQ